jgi:hypothetical protein
MTFGMTKTMDRAERGQVAAARHAKRQRAKKLITEHMPDLVEDDGQACSFAVYAVLTLWARHGEGNAKPSEVRRYRAGHLTRIEDRHKTTTTAPAKTAAAPDSMESLAA